VTSRRVASVLIQIVEARSVSIGVIAACRDRDKAIAGGPRNSKTYPPIRTPTGTHVLVFSFIVCLYVHIPHVSAANDHAHAGGADLRPGAVVCVAGSPYTIPVAVGLVRVVGIGTVVVPYQAIPVGIGIADTIRSTGTWSIAAQSTFTVTK
jgi:hypothetical protein